MINHPYRHIIHMHTTIKWPTAIDRHAKQSILVLRVLLEKVSVLQ
jgi:hypothetical protein